MLLANAAEEAAQEVNLVMQRCPHFTRLSTRIKDAGIAIRHLRGRILFYTAGSRNGLETKRS